MPIREASHPKREPVQRGKSHLSGTDLQREEVIAKAELRGGGQDEKDHQRAVEQTHGGETLGCSAKITKERNRGGGPGTV